MHVLLLAAVVSNKGTKCHYVYTTVYGMYTTLHQFSGSPSASLFIALTIVRTRHEYHITRYCYITSSSVRLSADEAKTIRVKQRAARITYIRNSRHMSHVIIRYERRAGLYLRPILYVSETHMIDTYSYTNGVTQQTPVVRTQSVL